ncbi:MAG: hypothetical protein MJ075_06745 [Oscillospiraceae bacterium]|nr:hypothetical protein [Oscillospiraceae bacterium]
MNKTELRQLGDWISYIPAEEEPLSSDVFLIEGERYIYAYDVGSSQRAGEQLQSLPKPLIVMLSHFHKDHTANLSALSYERLYVGGKTRQLLKQGETLSEDRILIQDGPLLELRRCPSVHENGSLILTVNREYTLLGDLIYPRGEPDPSKATAMLKELASIDTDWFVVSHRKDKVFEKTVFLRMVKQTLSITQP